jgi:hypothetical protein
MCFCVSVSATALFCEFVSLSLEVCKPQQRSSKAVLAVLYCRLFGCWPASKQKFRFAYSTVYPSLSLRRALPLPCSQKEPPLPPEETQWCFVECCEAQRNSNLCRESIYTMIYFTTVEFVGCYRWIARSSTHIEIASLCIFKKILQQ